MIIWDSERVQIEINSGLVKIWQKGDSVLVDKVYISEGELESFCEYFLSRKHTVVISEKMPYCPRCGWATISKWQGGKFKVACPRCDLEQDRWFDSLEEAIKEWENDES